MFALRTPIRKNSLVILCVVLICVASHATTADPPGAPLQVSWAGEAPAAALLWGGYMNFTLSPACMRAVLVAAVSCSQVGLAGLAGCGVLVHQLQGICP